MPKVTYDNLRDEGCLAVGWVRSQITDTVDIDRMNLWPNMACERVALEYEWPVYKSSATLSIESSALSMPLPEDFLFFTRNSVVSHGTTGYGHLEWVDYADIQDARNSSSASGPPTIMAMGPTIISGTSEHRLALHVYPTPDATYTFTILYQRRPSDMTAGDDYPDAPYAMHDAIRLATRLVAKEDVDFKSDPDIEQQMNRAMARAWRALGAPTRANAGPLTSVTRLPPAYPRGRWNKLSDNFPDR